MIKFELITTRLLSAYQTSIYCKFATGKGKLKASQIPFELQPQVDSSTSISSIELKQSAFLKRDNLRQESKLTKSLKSRLTPIQDTKTTLMEQSNIATSYYQAEQQKIEHNIKTRNFYNEQYKKGQEKIERAPLDPYYEYKIAQVLNTIQELKQEYDDFKTMRVDYSERGKAYQRVAEGYDEKQRRQEFHQFMKYLQEYPGSIKGATMDQDPDSYIKYALKKAPKFVVEKIRLEKAMKKKNLKEEVQNLSRKVMGKEFYSNWDQWQQDRETHLPAEPPKFEEIKPIYHWAEIAKMPNVRFLEFQSYYSKLAAWSIFRYYYYHRNFKRHLEEACESVNEMARHMDPHPEQEWVEVEPAATSLCRYYRTLPQFLQDHPAVKNLYLGIEYSAPDIPIEEKEQLINKAAKYCLPMDEVSTNILQEFLKGRRTYLTPEIKDKIFSINPEYTWEIDKFLNELKEQKLRSSSNIQQRDQKFHTPPQLQYQWANDIPQLPVDFYDNEDGFWDAHIKNKLHRYDQAKPMMKVRKHFQH